MTINEYFEKFRNKIKPTQIELERARRRRDHALSKLKSLEIGILEVINSGSYARHTAIRPLNDIDVFVYLSKDDYPKDNLKRVLQTIARELRPSYSNNEVIVGNRSVKVKYRDGFSVDIVPAFSSSKNNLEPAEIIDRKSKRWILTSPKKHIEFAKEMKKIDPRYNEFVRMFKTWKRDRRRNYRSFFISLLIADAIKTGLSQDWDEATFQIINHVKKHSLDKIICFDNFYSCTKIKASKPVMVLDPSNINNNVGDDFTIDKKEEFLRAWDEIWNYSKKAVKSSTLAEAKNYWKKVFNEFPTKL